MTLTAAVHNLFADTPVTAAQLLGEVDMVNEPAPLETEGYDVAAELALAQQMREEKEESEAAGWMDGLVVEDCDFSALFGPAKPMGGAE